MYAQPVMALATAYAEVGDEAASKALLDRLPELLAARDALDAAILERRLGRPARAHVLFERAGDIVLRDARALHEFAQTKLGLTAKLARSRSAADRQTRRRLLEEALAHLERVTQMEAPATRHAWAWFNVAQARQSLDFPQPEVLAAYRRAISLAPGEARFEQAMRSYERRKR